jgi:hypothetical protein
MMREYLVVILFAGAAFAQQYEIGATVGYGVYRDGTIYSASGTADAGIRNRFAAGILLADEFSNYVSAEFNYLYHDGRPYLQAPGVKADIQGNSDALTCGLLFHFKREHRWWPFLAGGTGMSSPVRRGSAADSANRQPHNERCMEGRLQCRRRREGPSDPAHGPEGSRLDFLRLIKILSQQAT